MRLRPLELARPLVLVALVVSVATVVSHAIPSRPSSGPSGGARASATAQHGWCPLDRAERIPVGTACYCILPDRRTISGITSPLYYHGRVNPYFNLHPPAVPTLIK